MCPCCCNSIGAAPQHISALPFLTIVARHIGAATTTCPAYDAVDVYTDTKHATPCTLYGGLCSASDQPAATTSSTRLASLPDALLTCIASSLDARSVAALSATSPDLRTLVRSNDTIWQALCKRMLGSAAAMPVAWGASSWRHLYLSLLHPHGWMLGLWASQSTAHGGLMLVQAEAPSIVAYSVLATQLNGPVWLRRVFEVKLRTDGRGGTACSCCYQDGSAGGVGELAHAAFVQQRLGNGGAAFAFSCSRGCKHDLLDVTLRRTAGHMPAAALVLLKQLGEAGVNADAPEVHASYHHVQFMHFLAEHSQALLDGSTASHTDSPAGPIVFARLPSASPDITGILAAASEVAFAGCRVPRQLSLAGCSSAGAGGSSAAGRHAGVRPLAGLWRGTYGAHGIELLQLEDRGNCMVATKVTGDSNVPAGRVSFVIFTAAPLAITAAPGLPYTPPAAYTSAADFRPPGGSQPKFLAQAHYPASGHAAGRGYSEPTWVCNEAVVSSEHCFGMLWHIMHSFALFTRIDDLE